MKYNTKLIWDYINGEEIDDIEVLENDYKFMMQVIKLTKDKNMYDLCSSDVKNNYEFVKFMIETFSHDKKFINQLANNFFNKTDSNSIEYNELIFIMADKFENLTEESMEYNIKKLSFYDRNRLIYEMCIQNEYDLELKKEYGLGFIFALDDFSSSNIITRYFAYNYVIEIFYQQFYLLEELIHKLVSDYSKIEAIGVKKFILDYVSYYDKTLADYLHTNLDLIYNIELEIKKIGKNWDNFIEDIAERKREILFQEAKNIINDRNALFTIEDALNYIDKLKIVPEKLSVYPTDTNNIIDFKNMDFNSRLCLKEIIELAYELYSSPIIENKQPKEYRFNKEGAKVLEFRPNNKKRI